MSLSAREWLEREAARTGQPDEAELERIRTMTSDERWEAMRLLCLAHMEAIQSLPEQLRSEVLAYRDPLPPSSEAALKRLKAEYADRQQP